MSGSTTKQSPAEPDSVYLDYNATAPLRASAKKALQEALDADLGNPSSQHRRGRLAARTLTAARRSVAEQLDVGRDSITFVGNGSEANLLAIYGTVRSLPKNRRHVLTSPVEHPSVLETLKRLHEEDEIQLDLIPVDSVGRVILAEAEQLIRPETGFMSVMLANNELGTIQPIHDLAELVSGQGITLHTDAAQAVGKTPLNGVQMRCNLLSFSPHKFGGPTGVGVLVREGRQTTIKSPFSSGRQEQGLRGGTECVPLCASTAAGLAEALCTLGDESARLYSMRANLCDALRSIPGLVLHSPSADVLPGTINFSMPDVPGPWLVAALDRLGFAVSHGSACSSLAAIPSHVLLATGAKSRARNSVRVSFGWETNENDLQNLFQAIKKVVHKIGESNLFSSSQEP